MLKNQRQRCWLFEMTAVTVFLLTFLVIVQGQVTFLSTPTANAIFGQNLAFMCNDTRAVCASTTPPLPPECNPKNINYNKIAYSHTLANGTVLDFGTCSDNQSVPGWNVTWPSCDKGSSSLIIINVSLEDEGAWKCVSGSVPVTINIGVQYAPMLDYANANISPPPPTIDINIGVKIAYTIQVKAKPAVTNYTESCLRAKKASRLKLIEKIAGKKYTLTLNETVYSDFGNHTCQIKNSIGTLNLEYLVKPKGPSFTILKEKITAVSASLEWPPQSGGTYTPSYIIYYKQTNTTTWIASNEKKPLAQPAKLKVKYKVKGLVPTSHYDFKVKLVIEAIKHMDAAESNVINRIKTPSRPNITSDNIRVTTDPEKSETFVAWDKFTGQYTHMRVKFCLLESTGNLGACDVLTISDPRRLKVKLDLKLDRSYSFYFYVLDGDDVVFESAPLVAKSATDINGGVKLSGAEIGGIVVGIIAACLVLTAAAIVGVRVLRKKKEDRLKARANHVEPPRGRSERDRHGVRFNDNGHDNPGMIPDPYYQDADNNRQTNGRTPSSTLESEGSGVYEPVEDDGSRFYETPLPTAPERPHDPSTYASLKPDSDTSDRIYLNVPPPNAGLASVGQTSPKLSSKVPSIYENLPPPDKNKKARPPDVSTINHIYVNTGFHHGTSSIDDNGVGPVEEQLDDADAASSSIDLETRTGKY